MRDVIEANWNYNSVYEAAKAEGAIVTAGDLRARYGATDEENAAPILKPIFARLEALSKDPKNKKQLQVIDREASERATAPIPPKDGGPTLEESLTVVESSLVGIESCLAKPKCDFRYEWEKGINLAFPEFTYFRQAIRTIAIRGRLLALAGNPKEAAEKFKLALHLSRLTGDSPVLIAALVRASTSAFVFREIEAVIAARPTDSELRSLVRKAMLARDKPIDPRRAFEAELFFNWDMTTHLPAYLEDNGTGIDDQGYLRRISYIPGVTRAWRTRSLQYCRLMLRILKGTHGDPILASGAAMQVDSYLADYETGLSNYLGAILMPVFTQAFSSFVQDIANREVLLASLDVLDERQKLGHWPATLPVDRRDPFGSRELRYRVDGDHVRVWSIGKDHKDSGGKAKKEDKESDDLVVRL